jgi:hypothetical protein
VVRPPLLIPMLDTELDIELDEVVPGPVVQSV